MSALAELTSLVREHGLLVVGANVFAEQIGLPVPAIPTLIVAGALCARGDLSLVPLLSVTLISCIAADYFWFLLGRRRGQKILRMMCRISLSPDSCVRRTENFFEQWGSRSLLFAKFVPGLSTVAPPLAGATGVSSLEFLLFDGVGSLVWAGLAIATGRVLHRAIDRVIDSLEAMGNGAVFVIGALLLLFIAMKWVERRRFYQRLRMARITPTELRELIAQERPHIVADVRTLNARRRDGLRIPGAIAIDPERIGETLVDLPIDREIILYCT